MPDDDDRDERAHGRVGSVLNEKWTLERLVGIGGMAAVYAGLHRNGARAAVKVLHADIARIPQVRERFLREGYAANSVEHPGAVKVLDDDVIASGPDEGAAYLVMELLEGVSLEDRLERGPPIGERELLTIMHAVLGILEAAHAHGVVHRDLKPENLFLPKPEEGDDPKAPRVKILDFGLARVADARLRTMHGLAVGTPSYMPPEQAAGRVDEIDGRSDLFSLGATCFRILASRTVHPGRSPIEIAVKMAKEPAPKLRTVAPRVAPATADVIDRALEFKRADRWADAAAMRAAAQAALAKFDEESARAPAFPAPSRPPPPTSAEARTVVEPKSTPRPAPAASTPNPPTPAKVARPTNKTVERSVASILEDLGLRSKRRRRSLLPVVTVVFLLIVGGKVLQEELAGEPAPSPASSDSASDDAAPPVNVRVLAEEGGGGAASETDGGTLLQRRMHHVVRPMQPSHTHAVPPR